MVLIFFFSEFPSTTPCTRDSLQGLVRCKWALLCRSCVPSFYPLLICCWRLWEKLTHCLSKWRSWTLCMITEQLYISASSYSVLIKVILYIQVLSLVRVTVHDTVQDESWWVLRKIAGTWLVLKTFGNPQRTPLISVYLTLINGMWLCSCVDRPRLFCLCFIQDEFPPTYLSGHLPTWLFFF